MHEQLKISPRRHSGRLLPHEHTSYIPLAFLTFIVGVLLVVFSVFSTYAADPPPQSGSVGLSGTVPEAPPKVQATINSPRSGQHFSSSPITISGTCPTSTLVEVYKNNIFAGSTPCDNDGTYSVKVDLLFGKNSLTAQVYDVLNQAGPISKAVIVFYDASLPQASASTLLNFTGTQLVLNTDAAYRGVFPNQTLNVPVNVIGGTPPFAINVEWGDLTNKVIPRDNNSAFNATHVYKRSGTYEITLQGTDSRQLIAFLNVAAIVNGQPAIGATNVASSKPSTSKLLMLWPAYAIAATVVASFWLGERREKRILGATNKPQTPPFGIVPHSPS